MLKKHEKSSNITPGDGIASQNCSPSVLIEMKSSRNDKSVKLDDVSNLKTSVSDCFNSSTETVESHKLTIKPETTEMVRSHSPGVVMVDNHCWICHVTAPNQYRCLFCPRVFHSKCLVQSGNDAKNSRCPECLAILNGKGIVSPVMQATNSDQLCFLLKHIINIMKHKKGADYFIRPVNKKKYPRYSNVVYPMDLPLLEKNVENRVYQCPEEFLADVKWISHNTIVFDTTQIKKAAKALLKTCKREVKHIRSCIECSYNDLVFKDEGFIETCKIPHVLIWAQLEGYPPRPAKAIKCKDEMVECRFFGAHDRAWIPLKNIHLYSKISPRNVDMKVNDDEDKIIQEVNMHISKLQKRYGSFVYAEHLVPYNPCVELDQLNVMLPNYSSFKKNELTGEMSQHEDSIQKELTSVKKPKSNDAPVADFKFDREEIEKTIKCLNAVPEFTFCSTDTKSDRENDEKLASIKKRKSNDAPSKFDKEEIEKTVEWLNMCERINIPELTFCSTNTKSDRESDEKLASVKKPKSNDAPVADFKFDREEIEKTIKCLNAVPEFTFCSTDTKSDRENDEKLASIKKRKLNDAPSKFDREEIEKTVEWLNMCERINIPELTFCSTNTKSDRESDEKLASVKKPKSNDAPVADFKFDREEIEKTIKCLNAVPEFTFCSTDTKSDRENDEKLASIKKRKSNDASVADFKFHREEFK